MNRTTEQQKRVLAVLPFEWTMTEVIRANYNRDHPDDIKTMSAMGSSLRQLTTRGLVRKRGHHKSREWRKVRT